MGISLENISLSVDGEIYLEDISLNLKPGSRNIFLGRTLAGKTSLLRLMAGLDRPTKGRILVDGEDVTGLSVRKRNISMVYQQFINYPSFTVYDNIASPLKVAGMDKKEIDRRVNEAAGILHLETMLDKIPTELSGGQQQRTAIARALVKDSNLLLLDEPLNGLDSRTKEKISKVLSEINLSIILISHELEFLDATTDQIFTMENGKILTGDEVQLHQHVHAHPYGTREHKH